MFCYLNFKDNSTLARGCLNDLDAKTYEFCQKETDTCRLCANEDNCNTYVPGKSANFNPNGFLIALFASLTYIYFEINGPFQI